MAHLRALSTPFRICGRIRKFDQIDRILNVVVQVFKRRQLAGIKLASHTAVQNRQWFRTDVFAQQRSEERRVGKECRSRWSPDHYKKKTMKTTQSRPRGIEDQP